MTYIENSEQTISTYTACGIKDSEGINSDYAFTPYPSLTLSQRLELNKILHTGAITNNNVSTFSDQDIYDSPEPFTTNEEQKQNYGCCVIC